MNGSTTFDLPIGGMTCASCAGRVERALGKVPGVQRVSVNLANERAHIEVQGQMDPSVLIAAVDKAGYTATLPQSETATDADQARRLRRERWSLVAGILLALPLVLPMLVEPSARTGCSPPGYSLPSPPRAIHPGRALLRRRVESRACRRWQYGPAGGDRHQCQLRPEYL